MGRLAPPFDRHIAFTDAKLAVAAARHGGTRIDPEVEAERILKAFPRSGVSAAELAEAISEMIASSQDNTPSASSGFDAAGGAARATVDLPCQGPGGR